MLVNILVVQVQSTLLGASIKAKELKNQDGVAHILIAGFNEFLNDNAKWGIQVLRHLLSKRFGAQEVGLHLKDPQAVVEHMPILIDGLLSLVQLGELSFLMIYTILECTLRLLQLFEQELKFMSNFLS